jgi:integrase
LTIVADRSRRISRSECSRWSHPPASTSAGSSLRRRGSQANGLEGRGLPPLPHTTPHTLRRTYISIALLANNFDVKWVMGQVGHADSTMTMEVYAHLQQRAERRHGVKLRPARPWWA